MAETSKIAEMAMKLSEEVFSEFFWTQVGPEDHSWPCEDPDNHGVSSHPGDAVFYYDEPYSQYRTYVHCDMKSYAKGSISSKRISDTVVSLAKQVACAEKSDAWRELYMHGDATPNVCGLLFVYNHDGEYDKDFGSLLNDVPHKELPLPRGSRLFVLGPRDIFWISNVAYDIRQLRGSAGKNSLPPANHCKYFYPQLDGRANLQPEKARAATLEMLTSPWIVLEYKKGAKGEEKGYVIFYRREGDTEEEFMYLIDFLRRYQVLEDASTVQVRALNPDAAAAARFQKAKQRYIESLSEFGRSTELGEKVAAITFASMPNIVTSFSSIELGMDYA